MTTQEREKWLKIGAIVVVGLYLLDWLVIEPAFHHWSEQSEHITELREKVQRGHDLLDREDSIRGRWAEMLRTDLPEEVSAAEDAVIKGVNRWARESKASITNWAPQPRTREEGYEKYECRASANGDQASLSRLLYELETDPLPARLEDCEFSTREKTGQQLTLTMRFSFVRLDEPAADER